MSQYLGQHFLKNKAKLRKIVDALELKDNDVVVEIGPGHGELTNEIISKFQSLKVKKFKIIAIEKDKELAENLEFRIQNLGIKNVKIIQGDALKILPNLPESYILNSKSYKVVGNIPYYITGYLFRILGELENKPETIILLIQKEVAERICAKSPKMNPPHKSTRGMNLLAASVQFWAEPKIIGYVSRKDFSPQPKVESAIIKLEINNITLDKRSSAQCNVGADNYYQFIKILFKQPRKTIVNNIKSQISNLKNKEEIIEKLREIGVEANARPQDLNVENIVKMAKLFYN